VVGLFDRSLVAPVVIAVGTGRLWLLLVGGGAVLVVSVARWWRRTWEVSDGALRVRSGVLSRQEQVVPLDRVQQVTTVKGVRHRLLGLSALRVEVAGGGSSIELDALGRAAAARLQAQLLAGRAAVTREAAPVPTSDAPAPVGVPVVELSYAQLAVAGVTGAHLLVVFAAAASAIQLLDDLPGRPIDRLLELRPDAPGGAAAVGFGLIVGAAWLATAMGASILRDGGFRLTLLGDELHLRRGLLERREAVLPRARVQAVRLTASPLRRALGLTSLRLQSAGSGTDEEERRVVVPLLKVTDVDRVLGLVLPGAAPLPALTRPPPAARRRAVLRSVVPWMVLTVVLAAAGWPRGALAALGLPLAFALGEARYCALGHAWTDPGRALVARRGALLRRTVVTPSGRAQSATARSSPFQRRAGLATLVVDVAGPGTSPQVIDEATATVRSLQRALVVR